MSLKLPLHFDSPANDWRGHAASQDQAAHVVPSRGHRESAYGAWRTCDEMLRQYDRELIERWKEGINFLLLFAGLFSAVLTAFIVVSFPLLQVDLNQETNALLLQILAQLGNSSGSGQLSDALSKQTSSSQFQAAASAIAINSLWFSSLIFSLGTASIAILVMKWFQEYLAQGSDQVRENTRIRQFRYDGLKRWRVDILMALLPLLLQISLVLFFAGLIVLLWTVQVVVASIVTTLISIWALFWIATIVIPSVHRDCPYKSTEALTFFSLVQTLKRFYFLLRKILRRCRRLVSRPMPRLFYDAQVSEDNSLSHYYQDWSDREKAYIRRETGFMLDQRTLLAASATLADESLLEAVIRPCLRDLPRAEAMTCLLGLLTRHANCSKAELPFRDWSCWDQRTNTLMYMAVDILERAGSQIGHLDDQGLLITIIYNYFGGFRTFKAEKYPGKTQALHSHFFNVMRSFPKRNLTGVPPGMVLELVQKVSELYPPHDVIDTICTFANYICNNEEALLPTLHACHVVFRFITCCSEELLQKSPHAMMHYDHFLLRITAILRSLRLDHVREDLSLNNVISSVIQLGPACHALVQAHPALATNLHGFVSTLVSFHTAPTTSIHDRHLRHASLADEITDAQTALSALCRTFKIPEPQHYPLLAGRPVTLPFPELQSSQDVNKDVNSPLQNKDDIRIEG